MTDLRLLALTSISVCTAIWVTAENIAWNTTPLHSHIHTEHSPAPAIWTNHPSPVTAHSPSSFVSMEKRQHKSLLTPDLLHHALLHPPPRLTEFQLSCNKTRRATYIQTLSAFTTTLSKRRKRRLVEFSFVFFCVHGAVALSNYH